MKYILDTNVYLFAINSEAGEELYAGAVDTAAVGLVERYAGVLDRCGRVVAPTFQDWKEAGKLVAQITHKEPGRKSKVQQMLNDILIAFCARHVESLQETDAAFCLVGHFRDSHSTGESAGRIDMHSVGEVPSRDPAIHNVYRRQVHGYDPRLLQNA